MEMKISSTKKEWYVYTNIDIDNARPPTKWKFGDDDSGD